MTELIKAVLAVMEEVKSIDKNLNVGTGSATYKGVADKDVKLQIGQAMQKHGLIIVTKDIQPESTMSEWDQEETYGQNTQMKHKTLVFTKVKTIYTLHHVSGESMDLVGFGHGVDSQDKSAGKATTYALKYALLNTFLVPTGDIDDADTQHSDTLPQKPAYATKTVSKPQAPTGLHCDYHKTEMKLNKNGKPYHMDRTRPEGDQFCNGMGFQGEKDAWRKKMTTPVDETPIQRVSPKNASQERMVAKVNSFAEEAMVSMTDAEVEAVNDEIPF